MNATRIIIPNTNKFFSNLLKKYDRMNTKPRRPTNPNFIGYMYHGTTYPRVSSFTSAIESWAKVMYPRIYIYAINEITTKDSMKNPEFLNPDVFCLNSSNGINLACKLCSFCLPI